MGRAHDHGRGVGELGQQPGCVLEHPLQLAMGLREEDLHLLMLGPPERLQVAEVVDEEAVPLVGRDPPRARVRVGQVALPLERRHVGPDRRRRDLDDRVAGDLRGPDRLSGLDVTGHDGPQDRGLTIVELVVLVAGGHGQSGSS